MNIADELEKLQKLHASGFLTEAELARAKARVLDGEPTGAVEPVAAPTADGSRVESHLEQIRWQNDLEQLDREWEMERRSYIVSDKYGRTSIPTESGSVVGAIFIVGFGLFWMCMASVVVHAPAFFSLFGVVFIVAGVVSCISSFGKASGYEQAKTRYEYRRAELLRRPRH